MSDNTPKDLAGAIDIIEETYEFMLAYAAQGKLNDEDSSSAGIRSFLQRSADAMDQFGSYSVESPEGQKFLEVVSQDAAKASAAMRLVLAQKAVSSQLVDNLNASIHLRALLTDLFLLDDSLKLNVL